ncbi:MAG: chromosome segregation protein SMC [archaeon]|nr:chromosome segregation protein SMC [archaeon]
MVHIKRLTMSGFKSFGKKTDIVFDRGINVIVGPNGSGKSNVSDALCFALGRLSIKSMRAAKAKNLIFMGSKYVKPAPEAYVEIEFDNADRSFSIEKDAVALKRVVRRNGQSIYKINDETKTRAEVIEMLAQAGIDPYGFNLILQGQIQSVVKMHPEDRRKIIEEVAGISIYEARKEKSLKELQKTDERLKEINLTLRERRAYLNNLEKERAQALRFKDLENNVKRLKASVIQKKIDEKKKELEHAVKAIDEKNTQKEKFRVKAEALQKEIEELATRVNQINKHIQEASGVEQSTLHNQIANLRGEIEGLRARKENYENRRNETAKRIEEMTKSIPELQKEIEELKKESPKMAKKADEIGKKKEELAKIEEERKKVLSVKTELISLRERIRDKERQLAKTNAESESTFRQLEEYSSDLVYQNDEECSKTIESIKGFVAEKRKVIEELVRRELESEKLASVAESDIRRSEKIKSDVSQIDVCPLCQSRITGDHKSHVQKEADEKIKEANNLIENIRKELAKLNSEKNHMIKEIRSAEDKSTLARLEFVKHKSIKEKKAALKRLVDDEKSLRDELKSLEDRRKELETKTDSYASIEEKYREKMNEIEEISSITDENVDTTIMYRQRDIERIQDVIKTSKENIKELDETIADLARNFDSKSVLLGKKEKQEAELNEKFKRMFEERDSQQKHIQEKNLAFSELQGDIRQMGEQVNYILVGKAQIDAQIEALGMEMSEFSGVEVIKASMEILQERLTKTQEAMHGIGATNMRALEVYDEVKKEYDVVEQKANTVLKEKEEIMKVVEEIDRKKTRTFMRTFNAMNELFTSNFSRLFTKGTAFLEIENKEDVFKGGVDIIVRMAKGKYFDVTSLSGGEQTMVALALLFAIQEHKPYHFYVFDEIDAALDKRNSHKG